MIRLLITKILIYISVLSIIGLIGYLAWAYGLGIFICLLIIISLAATPLVYITAKLKVGK